MSRTCVAPKVAPNSAIRYSPAAPGSGSGNSIAAVVAAAAAASTIPTVMSESPPIEARSTPSSSARRRAGSVARGPGPAASARRRCSPAGIRLQRAGVGEQARDRLGQAHLGALARGVQQEARPGRGHLDDRLARLDLGDRLTRLDLAAVGNEPFH
jgi:hypothetical protein